MSGGVPSLAFLLGRGCGDFVFYAQGERICKGYIVTKTRAHGRNAHARTKLKKVLQMSKIQGERRKQEQTRQ